MSGKRWSIPWRLLAAVAGAISAAPIAVLAQLLLHGFTGELEDIVASILWTAGIAAVVGGVVGFMLPRVGFFLFSLIGIFTGWEVSPQ